MTRLRPGWRWAVLGAAVALASGCRSTDPQYPTPPVQEATVLYPGIPPATWRAGGVSPPSEKNAGGLRPPLADVIESAAQQPDPDAAIDLGVALRLAGVGNPTINLAREAVRESLAGQLAARALLLPSVNVGTNFRLHRGVYQSSGGLIRDVDVQSLYVGAGAGAVGTGTVAFPGVRLFAPLGDAVYEPLAARQRVAARQSEAQAVQNAVLLDVAAAYLGLVGSEARRDIIRRSQAELGEVVRLTNAYAETGQGLRANANRAAARADLLLRERERAEEEVAVASARLCRLLTLDPSVRLRTPAAPVGPVRLIPEDAELESLVAGALRARPEVLARSAVIREWQVRVRQERVRPWVPIVSVGYSYGGFGGGSNLAPSDFAPPSGRSDFDALAVWNVQNLGFGNRARVRAADAGVGAAVAEYDATVNEVRREVSDAVAAARAAATQIKTAEPALAAAEEGFRLEMDRIRQAFPIGRARPIEVLDSFNQLLDARQELLRATIAFDLAQFRLFVAVGNTPRE